MPKMDGVSATNLIRQFDHMTPIISMTSNSKPSEIMTYYSSGMNDILPKPFTKEGLLDMLEVRSLFCTEVYGLTLTRMDRNTSCTLKSSNKCQKYHVRLAFLLSRTRLSARHLRLGRRNYNDTLLRPILVPRLIHPVCIRCWECRGTTMMDGLTH
jgi:CheY-like chemotaxis protein